MLKLREVHKELILQINPELPLNGLSARQRIWQVSVFMMEPQRGITQPRIIKLAQIGAYKLRS